MASTLGRFKFVLRVFEVVFALIVFAAAGWLLQNNWNKPYTQFMTFTGVTGFLWALFFIIAAFVTSLGDTCFGLIETVVNFIWWIFWLSAAAAFAGSNNQSCRDNGEIYEGYERACNTFLAAEAFAWMSFILWLGSLVLSVLEMRAGVGLSRGGGGQGRMNTSSEFTPYSSGPAGAAV